MEDATIVSIHTKRTVMALDAKLDGLAFNFPDLPLLLRPALHAVTG
jgi:hypothetical protein